MLQRLPKKKWITLKDFYSASDIETYKIYNLIELGKIIAHRNSKKFSKIFVIFEKLLELEIRAFWVLQKSCKSILFFFVYVENVIIIWFYFLPRKERNFRIGTVELSLNSQQKTS